MPLLAIIDVLPKNGIAGGLRHMYTVLLLSGIVVLAIFLLALINSKIFPRIKRAEKLALAGVGAFLIVISMFYSDGAPIQAMFPTSSSTPTQAPKVVIPTIAPTQAPTLKQASAGTETAVGNFFITVGDVNTTQDISGTKTEDQFVTVAITIKNGDDRARDISSNMFTLVDGKGISYEAADIYYEEYLVYETVNPGLTRKYKVAFETPAGISGLKLRANDGVAFASESTTEFTL